MIDAQLIWQQEWDKLPLDSTGSSGPTNIGNMIDARVTSKMGIAPPFLGSVTFTFNKAIFIAGITGLPPATSASAAAAAFAAAFSSACLASTFVVDDGACVGAPTPPTTWAAPPVTVFNPGTVSAGAASLQAAILAAAPVSDPLTSAIPKALYAAFTSLAVIATGINKLDPPVPLIFSGPVQ